jgi:2-keto-4-pentenoate hydratase/2-oxohepta-3-ene-1,7-dioic acid hydratase in catechol pathway
MDEVSRAQVGGHSTGISEKGWVVKVIRFDGGRIGLVTDGQVVDVSELVCESAASWPPQGVLRLIRDFESIAALARTLNTPRLPIESVKLEAPIVWPNKVLAFPVNYRAHGEEMKSSNRADLNGFFLKANSSISGPLDAIVLPDLPGRNIHHECELAVIIGRQGRSIARAHALDYVFGYSCLVDVVVRGTEERVMRKSYDSFCPIGPWIVTADQIPDPQAIDLRLWVNGELRQSANTRDMILDIAGMIELASAVATLYPGDVIATGTPAGVGPIVRGDEVRISIERVGEMTLSVV